MVIVGVGGETSSLPASAAARVRTFRVTAVPDRSEERHVAVVKLRVVEVAPETLLNVTPLSVLTCHCTVGVGEPVAAAVKVAVWPVVTVWFAGCMVIVGVGVETSRLPLSSTARLRTFRVPEVAAVKT